MEVAPMTKNEIEKSICTAVDKVERGEREPLELYIALSELADTVDACIKQIKEPALREAKEYNGQDYKGYGITVRESGGRYSYDHIPEYVELKERIKAIEKQAQIAYKLSLSKLDTMVVSGEGEVLQAATYRSGSESIILKNKGA
jgi:hypothetical protein